MRTIPKVKLIIDLIRLGYSDNLIAKESGAARRTVKKIRDRIEKEPSLTSAYMMLDDKELYNRVFPPKAYRASKAVPDTAVDFPLSVQGTLKKALYHEYVKKCEDTGKNALQYDQYCRKLREEDMKHRGTDDMTVKAGKDVVVFWLQKPVSYLDEDRTVRKSRLFLGILPYSTYVFAKLFKADTKENWITAHNEMFFFFGGSPNVLHAEKSKSSCFKGEIQRHYAELASHYAVYVKLDGSEQYSMVTMTAADWFRERLSSEPYLSFSAACDHVRNIHKDYCETSYREGMARSRLFYDGERKCLHKLRNGEYVPAEIKNAKIRFNCHVKSGNWFYSVPYKYALMNDKTVQLELTEYLIRVFYHGELISTHTRKTKGGGYQTNPLDMPPEKDLDLMEWNPKRFIAWAESIGPDTEKLIRRILQSKKIIQQTYVHCITILSMERKYGPGSLEEACGAVEIPNGIPAYKVIRDYLDINYGKRKPAL